MANKKKAVAGENDEVTITIEGEPFQDLDYLLKNDGQKGAPSYTRSAEKAISVYANFLRSKTKKGTK